MIPRAVREAGERADALYAQAYGNTEQTPAPEDQQPPSGGDQQMQAPEPEPAEPPPQPAIADAAWEEKYRVLSGKYAAEVPRLAQELRELKAQLNAANERLTQAPQPVEEVNKLTPAQVVEQFGDDFAAAVAAIADQRAGRIRDELAPRMEQVANSASLAVRESFMRELTAQVPDWQVIDQDARFTAFLDEVDPMSGLPRRHFFTEADQRNDAARIAHFFKSFRGATQAPAAAPAPAMPSRMGVEYQLAPSSSRTAEAPPGKRLWSQADIRQFYRDVQRGRVTPQDAARIESDIFAAQRENRLTA